MQNCHCNQTGLDHLLCRKYLLVSRACIIYYNHKLQSSTLGIIVAVRWSELSSSSTLVGCALSCCKKAFHDHNAFLQQGRVQQIAKVLQQAVDHHNWLTTYKSACPSSWFKHSKSIVVFHCSARLLQDYCNLLYVTTVWLKQPINFKCMFWVDCRWL